MNQISVLIAVMLCIVSSVTDIRKGIIPNRFVFTIHNLRVRARSKKKK